MEEETVPTVVDEEIPKAKRPRKTRKPVREEPIATDAEEDEVVDSVDYMKSLFEEKEQSPHSPEEESRADLRARLAAEAEEARKAYEDKVAELKRVENLEKEEEANAAASGAIPAGFWRMFEGEHGLINVLSWLGFIFSFLFFPLGLLFSGLGLINGKESKLDPIGKVLGWLGLFISGVQTLVVLLWLPFLPLIFLLR